VPACYPAAKGCVDSRTGDDVCCTADCEVIAVGNSSFSLLDHTDPSKGVRLTYMGATPTQADRYACDWDPSTGAPYPRVTHYSFACDEDVQGFAKLVDVQVNPTNDCEYTLFFKTDAVCMDTVQPRLSGGWVFLVVLFTLAAVYATAGTLWIFQTKNVWQFPNAGMWRELDALMFEGAVFLAHGCRRPEWIGGDASATGSGGAKEGFHAVATTGGYNAVSEAAVGGPAADSSGSGSSSEDEDDEQEDVPEKAKKGKKASLPGLVASE
jgi:hypothetical protein